MVHRTIEVAESRGARDTKWVRRLTFLLTLCLVAGLAGPSLSAPDRPNVVIFLADDLGWGDVGFHGGPIETPHIDRLAREGVELGRFYVTPICSPTRAALMTGRDPIKLGVAYQVFEAWDNHGVHPEERFLSEAFRAAGYQTATIGKWHLGHAQETYLPGSRGFDHFYGHLNTEVGYFPPFAAQGGKDFQRNGKSVDEEGYETFMLAEEAVRWIRERDKSRPFLLYMPFLAPHTPLDAPEALEAKYADLDDDRKAPRGTQDWSRYLRFVGVESLRPLYAAVVDGMDQSIGRVLATLDEEGLAENSIVLFFSDNGGMTTFGVGGADNAPLRGGKGETFEGGIRVVSVVRWPGHLEAGGGRADHLGDGPIPHPGGGRGDRGRRREAAGWNRHVAGHLGGQEGEARGLSLLRIRDPAPRQLQAHRLQRGVEAGAARRAGHPEHQRPEHALPDR
jgi:arylsulfatase B